MDCFFSINHESATQSESDEQKMQPEGGAELCLRFMLHRRDLPPPVIDAAEFVQLQHQHQQQRRQRHEQPDDDDGRRPSPQSQGTWGKSVGVQALADVIGQVLLQRPMARLAIGGPAELAFTIKALGLAADAASRNRRGGLLAFLSASNSDEASPPSLLPAGSDQSGAKAAPQGSNGGSSSSSSPLSFPLQLDVQRVKTLPLRSSVFGPARGHLAEGSTREGFRKALSGEVSVKGGISAHVAQELFGGMHLPPYSLGEVKDQTLTQSCHLSFPLRFHTSLIKWFAGIALHPSPTLYPIIPSPHSLSLPTWATGPARLTRLR